MQYDIQQQRCLAFSAVCQCLRLVQEVARKGSADDEDISRALSPIVVTDPDNLDDIYGSPRELTLGLQTMIHQLGDQKRKDLEVTRYLVGILALERKLVARNGQLGLLAQRIDQVKRQLNHFSITDSQVIANLSGIYVDVISDLGPKIQITGNPNQLQQTHNQQKIRALLLAAMRSAVLWRQLGGKRRHLVFSRKSLIQSARSLLIQ
ncbi:high frequency lysogenization protein HflD [Paraferrimonas sedimenticola]|uniref:High frequency lysogenization protein HflD homolog n=1 Tax=Paraferrimonas sedimenticola TaxID=375674 RepID=A0AA37W2A5_9GAMM|nr:high frequency lysogenization protein HflD [Paraferrimonas sedimenticola]GLP97855.1 high frequency lysogenization protein HflD [Paraferrimonas sedimenticola]